MTTFEFYGTIAILAYGAVVFIAFLIAIIYYQIQDEKDLKARYGKK